MTLISVIIPVYNGALLIRRAVESALGQKGLQGDWEVVVVDDASTDDTLSVVGSIRDPRLRLLRQRENWGPAAARNRGLREARGKYCAFLDGDDFWEPGFLSATSSFLEAHPETVAVNVGQCHKLIGKAPSYVPKGTGIEKPVVLPDFFAFWGRFPHVCTGSVLFRRDIALAIGGQREELRICEDLEFWAMLATYGKWGFLPQTLITSDGGEVTRQQGWLEKNLRRWQSAPSFDHWKRRLLARQGAFDDASLDFALGGIARNLCYCHIMAGKEGEARREVLTYGRQFPPTRINTLFRTMAATPLSWNLWCRFLRWREFHRKL